MQFAASVLSFASELLAGVQVMFLPGMSKRYNALGWVRKDFFEQTRAGLFLEFVSKLAITIVRAVGANHEGCTVQYLIFSNFLTVGRDMACSSSNCVLCIVLFSYNLTRLW